MGPLPQALHHRFDGGRRHRDIDDRAACLEKGEDLPEVMAPGAVFHPDRMAFLFFETVMRAPEERDFRNLAVLDKRTPSPA